jgi:protein-disulfide isomerase
MNTKRLFFWLGFIVVLGLIIWGLIVAMNKSGSSTTGKYGTAPAITLADHVRGPATAPVTITEYSDFQCPACEAYEPVLEKLEAVASSSFKLVYRHYPLPQHPNALPAAYASEAASLQGKFWEMHDLLFANHTDWTEESDATPIFIGYATKLGLDVNKFKTDMASDAVKTRVQSDADEAQTLKLDYTPTFFLNGTVIPNPQGYEPFLSVIQNAASSSPQ